MITPKQRYVTLKNPVGHQVGLYKTGAPILAYTGEIDDTRLTFKNPVSVQVGINGEGEPINAFLGTAAQNALLEYEKALPEKARKIQKEGEIVNIGMDNEGNMIDVRITGDEVAAINQLYDLKLSWPPNYREMKKKHGYWENLILNTLQERKGEPCTVSELIKTAKEKALFQEGKIDRRREYCKRALQSLSEAGEVTIKGEIIVNDSSDLVSE